MSKWLVTTYKEDRRPKIKSEVVNMEFSKPTEAEIKKIIGENDSIILLEELYKGYTDW